VLAAQTLLAGRTWVAIEYNGQLYRLQTTRAGKLILTK
jgi:hemin uptake protein HemP